MKKWWKLIVILMLIFILTPLGIYGYKIYKEKIEYQTYKKDASATFIELEKLSATLVVGITYMDYKKKLGEINYPVSIFLDKYKKYQRPPDKANPISYQVINNSMEGYLNLAKKWEIAIDAGDSYFLLITKDHMGKGWAAIAYHIKLSRQILEEKEKETRMKLIKELAEAQNLWNNEDEDYHKKLNAYKEVLQRTADEIKANAEAHEAFTESLRNKLKQ